MTPSSACSWLRSTWKYAAASPSNAWNAVAAACRSSGPPFWIVLLPAVVPWSGVTRVSPCT